MIYTSLTKKALKLCFEAHKKQVDKNVAKLKKLHESAQTADANPAADAANGIEEGIIQERRHKKE